MKKPAIAQRFLCAVLAAVLMAGLVSFAAAAAEPESEPKPTGAMERLSPWFLVAGGAVIVAGLCISKIINSGK